MKSGGPARTPRPVVMFLVLVTVALSCRRPGIAFGVGVAPAADSRRISYEAVTRPGQLTWDETAAIAPRVVSLRAEPPSLTLRVGDTVSLQARVRILAIDSAGSVLGELSRYSHAYTGRELWMHADGRVRGRNAGRVNWAVRFPETLWTGDRAKVPALIVPLTLSRTENSSPPIAP